MYHVQLERGENFLEFHIKLTFVNVSINKYKVIFDLTFLILHEIFAEK
jgi:hypothetical protein